MRIVAIGLMMLGALSFASGLLFPVILVMIQIVSWLRHGFWTPQPVWHMTKALGAPPPKSVGSLFEIVIEPLLNAPLSLFTLIVFPVLGAVLMIWGHRIEERLMRTEFVEGEAQV